MCDAPLSVLGDRGCVQMFSTRTSAVSKGFVKGPFKEAMGPERKCYFSKLNSANYQMC